MIERQVQRNGETVTEVRSEGGKLLYIKTSKGYEMKCPRTKQICVVSFDQMLKDCLSCMTDLKDERFVEEKAQEIKSILEVK